MIDVVTRIGGNERISMPGSPGNGPIRAVIATVCRSVDRARPQPAGRPPRAYASRPFEHTRSVGMHPTWEIPDHDLAARNLESLEALKAAAQE